MPQRTKIALWIWGAANALGTLVSAYFCVQWLMEWQSGDFLADPKARDLCGLFLFATVCALQNAFGAYKLYRREKIGYLRFWVSYAVVLVGWFYLKIEVGSLVLSAGILGGYAALLVLFYWLMDVAGCGKEAEGTSPEADT